jgi:DNA-directed RNA polymerase specialized sigma24 family protein
MDAQRAAAYISTVARNLLRTMLRSAARNRERASEIDANLLPARTSAADMQLEYEKLVLAVHSARLTLPQELRSVVIGLLRGETLPEIAAALNISPVTVRTRPMRVRAISRPKLAPYTANSASLHQSKRWPFVRFLDSAFLVSKSSSPSCNDSQALHGTRSAS